MEYKHFRWNNEKNEWLKQFRDISFEELIDRGRFICFERHANRLHQRLMLFEFEGYIWAVPIVKDGDFIFMKTAFANRKYTRIYLERNK